ncbi:MAG: hypothetical protein LUD81_08215 [Clostridiales bacterium]|nr:hypothetical protein [Clostridiales bacterium]
MLYDKINPSTKRQGKTIKSLILKKSINTRPSVKTKRDTPMNHIGVKDKEPHIIPKIRKAKNTGIGLFIEASPV